MSAGALDVAVVASSSVAAIWLGYPLTVGALAALRRPGVRLEERGAAAPAEPPPAVSVLLATRDPADAVRLRVLDCLAADYPADRLEVVVALDVGAGAGPATYRAALPPGVTVVSGDFPGGKAATLNAGVRASRGEVLVFTDTFQRFAPDTVRRLVEAMRDPRVGAVSGSLELPAGGRVSLAEHYWRYERWLRRSEAALHSPVGVTGAVSATRRALWRPLPAGLILDDVYMPMRVVLDGHRVAFAHEARATETRVTAPAREYHRKVRTLTGVLQLCAWLPAVLVPVRNPIWAQFVFHKLLRLATPYLLLAAGIAASLVAARLLGPWPSAGALLAIVALLVTRRATVREALLLQAAIVVATVNGLRGRWDVWRPGEAAPGAGATPEEWRATSAGEP